MDSKIKVCPRCKLPKDAEKDYYPRKGKKGTYPSSHCKVCSKVKLRVWAASEAGKAWRRNRYRKNRTKLLENLMASKRRRRKENQELVLAYLKAHPCTDCGETDPIVLQFDHVRGKKQGTIGNMVHAPLAQTTIVKEIEKCEVRCANCHTRRTSQEWWGLVAKKSIASA